jgi:hypothetical protein
LETKCSPIKSQVEALKSKIEVQRAAAKRLDFMLRGVTALLKPAASLARKRDLHQPVMFSRHFAQKISAVDALTKRSSFFPRTPPQKD